MILRRITNALRRQDWVTVLIEVSIVVIGLLIGLQINNWNEGRAETQAERKFLERLHMEIVATQEDISVFSNSVERRAATLKTAADILFGDNQESELTDLQCSVIFISHAYNFPPTDLPTIGEILSSGQFNIISDYDLRATLSRMGQINARAENYSDLFNASPLALARAYPDLMTLKYSSSGEGTETPAADYDSSVQCDLAGMRKSRAFLNDFVINAERYDTYELVVVDRLLTQFGVIHEELDRVLGYTHEDNTQ